MVELVLNTNTLPETLFRLIKAEKVKVSETGGEIKLTPITDAGKGCPLRGLCADGRLSSYAFMEAKQSEKKLEKLFASLPERDC